MLGFNLLKFLFIWYKYRLQPFTKQSFLFVVIALMTLAVNQLLPFIQSSLVDVLIRSARLPNSLGLQALSMHLSMHQCRRRYPIHQARPTTWASSFHRARPLERAVASLPQALSIHQTRPLERDVFKPRHVTSYHDSQYASVNCVQPYHCTTSVHV